MKLPTVTPKTKPKPGWDYPCRVEPPPSEQWSACPEKELLHGVSLHDKAAYYDWIVPALHSSSGERPRPRSLFPRLRHRLRRPGADADCRRTTNFPSAPIGFRKNNGLWTSLYVASQAFRYAATHDPEALNNLRRTLNGTYQMLAITGKPGLYTRDFRDPTLAQQYCIEDEEPYASAGHEQRTLCPLRPAGGQHGGQSVRPRR